MTKIIIRQGFFLTLLGFSLFVIGINHSSAAYITAGDSQWDESGSGIYYNTANVGIGTTDPASIFHVNGGTGGYGIFERGSKRLYVNANWSGQGNYAQLAPRNTDNMGLSLSSEDTSPEYLFIANSGNVGIGTTDPTFTLDTSNTNSPVIAGGEAKLVASFGDDTNHVRFTDGKYYGVDGSFDNLHLGNSYSTLFKNKKVFNGAADDEYSGILNSTEIELTAPDNETAAGIDNYIYNTSSQENSGSIYGLSNRFSNSGGGSLNAVYGVLNSLRNDDGGSLNAAYGIFNSNKSGSASTVGTAYGMYTNVSALSTSTITTAYGAYYKLSAKTGGTVTTAYGISVKMLPKASSTMSDATGLALSLEPGGGVINGYTGMMINQTEAAIDNNSLVLLGTDTRPTGDYSIYNASVFQNYFAGNVGIGITNPSTLLDVSGGTGDVIDSSGGQVSGLPSVQTNDDHAVSLKYLTDNYQPSSGDLWSGTKNGLIWNGDAGVGNVGIGTISPNASLEIEGAGDGTGFRVGNTNANGTQYAWLDNTGAVATLGAVNTQNTTFPTMKFTVTNSAATSERMRIDSSGNVGIGTTDPTSNLEVDGRIEVGNGSATAPSIVFGGDFNTGFYRPTGDQLGISTAGTERMRFNSSGYVGIGTTNPDNILHAYGTQATPAFIEVENVNSTGELGAYFLAQTESTTRGAGIAMAQGSTSHWYAGIPYANSTRYIIGYNTGAWAQGSAQVTNAKMTLQSNGNVGIGITNPSTLLDVFGGTGDVIDSSGGQVSGLPSVQTNDDHAVSLKYLTDNYQPSSGELWSGTKNGLIWNGDAGVGNVGIGITNPDAKLSVVHSSSGKVLKVLGPNLDNVDLGEIMLGYNSGGTAFELGSIGVQQKVGGGTKFMYLGTSVVDKALVIDRDGNVGIGTTEPEAPLQIVKTVTNGTETPLLNLYSKGSGVNHGSSIQFKNDGGGYMAAIAGLDDATANGRIEFRVNPTGIDSTPLTNANTAMTIKSSGNVGVGTTDPGSKLEISGTSGTTPVAKITATGNARYMHAMDFYNSGIAVGNELMLSIGKDSSSRDNGQVYFRYVGDASTSNSLSFGLYGVDEVLNVVGTGNVGIGTTDPTSNLEVDGRIEVGNGSATAPSIVFGGDFNTGFYRPTGDQLGISTAGTERMRFNSSGNVGIGTTDPSTLLDVSGTTGNAIDVSGGQVYGLNSVPTDASHAVSLGYLEANYSSSGECNSATISSAGWYRIASNGPVTDGGTGGTRAHALFNVWEGNSGLHSAVSFYAGVHFGGNPNITLLSRSSYNATGLIDKIRVVEGETYEGAAVEIYIGEAGSIEYCFEQDYQANGWAAVDWTAGSVPSGFLTTTLNIDTNTPVFAVATGSGSSDDFYISAAGSAYFNSITTAGGMTLGGDLNMGGQNILGVEKLTVNTIDPLYNIGGINYSSFAASVVGGVKEEYIGKAYVNKEKVIDFDNLEEGEDLWVWRKTVDFNRDNVDVLITPYGKFAEVYYEIEGSKLIFKSDRPVEISYRLVGKRFDWLKWPTKAIDQTEKGWKID